MKSANESNATPYRILTVGDGDLSFSLALKRAYPKISVTASTLVETPAELLRTYSNTAAIMKEFCDFWNEEILYSVDATRLDDSMTLQTQKYDIVMFNHPHLGDATLHISEKHHAQRHHVLLCHYFHSAKGILTENGRIHVCLCGSQPTTWNVMGAASRNGLRSVSQVGTTPPLQKWLFEKDSKMIAADVQTHYPCKRKYRNGKLGSKHSLGRYGYSHRRTGGDLYGGNVADMAVHQSVNFIFTLNNKKHGITTEGRDCECIICGVCFSDDSAMHRHLEAPAMPDIMTGEFLHQKIAPVLPPEQNEQFKSSIHETTAVGSPVRLNDTSVLMEATVQLRFDSKRIKWLCRQEDFPLSKYMKSKKQCKDVIKSGRIFVNSNMVTDDGRIVKENDVITLIHPLQQAKICSQPANNHYGVRILKNIPIEDDRAPANLIVAYKPVGIRVVGSFAPNTLEMIVQSILNPSSAPTGLLCTAVSKLETGCGGLCVLVASSSPKYADLDLEITYKFNMLIHGAVPEWREGIYVKLPSSGPRNWKRRKIGDSKVATDETTDNTENPDYSNSDILATSSQLDLNESLLIKCIDTFSTCINKSSTSLSTLEVWSAHDSGRLSNVISFVLRKLGHPVVNDRFCKREFAELPRVMRNLLKQKICICCDSLEIKLLSKDKTLYTVDETVSTAPNGRTQCAHWRGVVGTR